MAHFLKIFGVLLLALVLLSSCTDSKPDDGADGTLDSVFESVSENGAASDEGESESEHSEDKDIVWDTEGCSSSQIGLLEGIKDTDLPWADYGQPDN